jgi:hypothetical protein
VQCLIENLNCLVIHPSERGNKDETSRVRNELENLKRLVVEAAIIASTFPEERKVITKEFNISLITDDDVLCLESLLNERQQQSSRMRSGVKRKAVEKIVEMKQ